MVLTPDVQTGWHLRTTPGASPSGAPRGPAASREAVCTAQPAQKPRRAPHRHRGTPTVQGTPPNAFAADLSCSHGPVSEHCLFSWSSPALSRPPTPNVTSGKTPPGGGVCDRGARLESVPALGHRSLALQIVQCLNTTARCAVYNLVAVYDSRVSPAARVGLIPGV